MFWPSTYEGRGGARRAAQRGVEHRAVLGGVDVGTGEHGVAPLLDAHLAGKLQQQLQVSGGDQVLGQIDVQIGGGGVKRSARCGSASNHSRREPSRARL